ncbi:hypothetical protein V8G54_022383 [Vigna mungo]|uniref:Uncharacterized protein n=1 Tax=Vigna mungo TaxID=3915 RepID=A0AAQ3NHY3_VIGMU
MLRKSFVESSSLMPYVCWIHVVEDRQNVAIEIRSRFQYPEELVQAPPRRGVVRRENHHGTQRLVNRLEKRVRDDFSSLQLFVVSENGKATSPERSVEVVRKTVACVFSSEAEKHVEFPRRSFTHRCHCNGNWNHSFVCIFILSSSHSH